MVSVAIARPVSCQACDRPTVGAAGTSIKNIGCEQIDAFGKSRESGGPGSQFGVIRKIRGPKIENRCVCVPRTSSIIACGNCHANRVWRFAHELLDDPCLCLFVECYSCVAVVISLTRCPPQRRSVPQSVSVNRPQKLYSCLVINGVHRINDFHVLRGSNRAVCVRWINSTGRNRTDSIETESNGGGKRAG